MRPRRRGRSASSAPGREAGEAAALEGGRPPAPSASSKPEKRARYRVAPSRTTFSVKGEALARMRRERLRASSSISFALSSSSMAPSWITQRPTGAGEARQPVRLRGRRRLRTGSALATVSGLAAARASAPSSQAGAPRSSPRRRRRAPARRADAAAAAARLAPRPAHRPARGRDRLRARAPAQRCVGVVVGVGAGDDRPHAARSSGCGFARPGPRRRRPSGRPAARRAAAVVASATTAGRGRSDASATTGAVRAPA